MKAESQTREQLRVTFEQLYQRHGREVWSVAYGRWAQVDFARDICQDVFLRLWKLLESGGVLENPRAWLLRVARNLAEDVANSAFARNGTQSPEHFQALNARDIPPLEKLEQDESFARVRRFLEELNPADREILLFRYALDLSCEEIAERFDTTVVAVHMRLSRARQRFAERLAASGVEPRDLIPE